MTRPATDIAEAKRNLDLSTDLYLQASWARVYGPSLIARIEADAKVIEAAKEYCQCAHAPYDACLSYQHCRKQPICAALAERGE